MKKLIIFVVILVLIVFAVDLMIVVKAHGSTTADKWTKPQPVPPFRYTIFGTDLPARYETRVIVWNAQGTCISFDKMTVCGSFIVQDNSK